MKLRLIFICLTITSYIFSITSNKQLLKLYNNKNNYEILNSDEYLFKANNISGFNNLSGNYKNNIFTVRVNDDKYCPEIIIIDYKNIISGDRLNGVDQLYLKDANIETSGTIHIKSFQYAVYTNSAVFLLEDVDSITITRKINVEASETGVKIYANGYYVGETPTSFTIKGIHDVEITASKDGYLRQVKTYTTRKNEDHDIYFDMGEYDINPRTITLESNPTSNASIRVRTENSTYTGKTPFTFTIRGKQELFVELSKNGVSNNYKILVIDDKDAEYKLEYDAEPREVQINSTPANADISINGEYIGKCPVSYKVYGKQKLGVKLSKKNYHDTVETLTIDQKLTFNLTLKFDTSFDIEDERGNFGFTFMFLNNPKFQEFKDIYKVAYGINYHINFGWFDYVKFYFSTDVLTSFAIDKPDYMNNGFLFFNNYAFGLIGNIPIWRFIINFGGAAKIGYMIEYVENSSLVNDIKTNTDAYFGFGCEGIVGLKFMITERVGIFVNYRIGLLQDLMSIVGPVQHGESAVFNNLDGHSICFGIRF